MPVRTTSKPRTTIRQWFFLGLALTALIGVVLSQRYILTRTAHAAAFTSGNLVIYRVGPPPSGTPNANATAVFLDEYTPAGTLVQSIAIPTADSGANKMLTASGTATSEGLLTRSADGNYVVFAGYRAAVGTTGITGSASSSVNRVIGRVDASGNIDTSTALTDAISAGNPRGAASTNGTDLWLSGTSTGGGIRYATLAATTSTALSTATPLNIRATNIFNGQLYISSATSTFLGVSTVGSGTPTTGGQTITPLPGFPTSGTHSNYQFAFANASTLYVADDGNAANGGGIQKWTLSSGTWSLAYILLNNGTTTTAVRGLTVDSSGANNVIYATTTAGSANTLIKVTDTGAGSTATTLATAPANTAFRGVAFAPAAAAASPTPTGTPTPSLSINNVSQDEGNAGTTNFTFTVSLSSPAQTGGVTFTVDTADGTAQDDNPATEDNDYVAIVGVSGSIPEGSSSTQVTVQVNGDLTTEPNETFFVNITNVTGAGVTDSQGLGTIQNDDITLTPIHDIQGSGNSAPISVLGTTVTTTGIVTGRKSNGFFIQDPSPDSDPNTSEAIFVFTSSAPSASIQVGDSVRVTGTVAEFEPSSTEEPDGVTPTADPKTATELTGPTTVIISSGNTLPAALDADSLNIFDPAALSRGAQLEKYEYMRISVDSITVSQPTNGFGEFWGVETGVARPFREPGIERGDPVPLADEGPHSGTAPPNVPIWDGNFERIMVDSDDATSTADVRRSSIFVTTGAVVTNIVGPLDFVHVNGTGHYRIMLDFSPTPAPVVTPGVTAAIPVPTPTAGEFTISHTNLENFTSSNATKLNKASLAIRNVLKTPDVVGLIEVDTTASATALADKINADVGNPAAVNYVAHFNDIAGNTQDIGYLVNTARVSVSGSATPYHQGNTFTYCGIANQTLHDRPSLVLNVNVPQPVGGPLPVTVILNHTKSLIAVDSPVPYGTCGTGTEGGRNREKRRLQAEDIADLIQLHITENLVVLGDLNAFDFNDGLGDVIGTLKGVPVPANEVVEPSTDDWTYTLTNLINTLTADQRYSFAFEGNAQALDHVLVNSLMLTRNTRYAYGRFNGDFSNDYAANASTPERVADHDAPVAYFNVTQADVSLTKTLDTAGPYNIGQTITYTLNVANAGPDTATNVQVTDTPTNITITNVSGSGCAALPCTIASIASGANTSITVTATIDSAAAFDNSATANADEPDPNSANNTDNTGNGGTAGPSADVSITKTLDTTGPYFPGGTITYTLDVANAGPSTATNIQVADTPTNLTITNVSGACASLPCTIASLASGGNTSITVTATINAAGAFDNSATANADEFDPNSANNTDNTSNGGNTSASADVSITKTLDTSGPYYTGGTITYTLDVANGGPSTATNIQVTDTPTNLTITNVSGACTSLPCTIASLGSGSNTSITVTATINAAGAFDNSATANADEFDPNSTNNTDNTNNGGTAGLPTLSIDDVTHFEGDSGTTSYVFTVTKTGTGAATVQFTTNNGTATLADNDYQSNSDMLSFASSDTTKQITVLVNGDTTPEGNETFTVDLSSPSGATITDGSGLGTINNDDEAANNGDVIISEFRFRGPGFVPGPVDIALSQKIGKSGITTPTIAAATNQAEDEFIEIYNNTDSDIIVSATDGSAGWAVVAADGVTRFIIPNNTVIPARGHFLGVNSVGYSLKHYGGPFAASGDRLLLADGVTQAFGYTLGIPDGSGIALFRTANPVLLTLNNRLDAAGYAGVDPLYREGTGFPTGGAETTSNLEHTFFRTMMRTTGGLPKDTGDNTSDFFLADTAGTDLDPGPGTSQRLGAPGPENLSSPINRTEQFGFFLLDNDVSADANPNQLRETAPVTNGTFGTLSIRRTFTNNTGETLSKLRFRIVEITTFPSPVGSGLADLRALDSSDDDVTLTSGAIVAVRGTTLEEPPNQNVGGGWNATLNVPSVGAAPPPSVEAKLLFDTPRTGTIVLGAPLNNGDSINVQFKLGVMQTGRFFFFLNIEASTGCPSLQALPCLPESPRD